jgi:hypothetical protein
VSILSSIAPPSLATLDFVDTVILIKVEMRRRRKRNEMGEKTGPFLFWAGAARGFFRQFRRNILLKSTAIPPHPGSIESKRPIFEALKGPGVEIDILFSPKSQPV